MEEMQSIRCIVFNLMNRNYITGNVTKYGTASTLVSGHLRFCLLTATVFTSKQ